jgi:ATP-binding cassette subfamily B protein
MAREKLTTAVRDISRTFRLVWQACGRWTALWLGLLIVSGVLPTATVQLTRLLVDGLTTAIGSGGGWSQAGPVLVIAGLMAAVLLLSECLQLAIEWVRASQAERVQDYIAGLVHEQSIALDMGFYELPDFHDQLHRARTDATTRPLALLDSGGSLLQNGVTLVAMAAVLLPYGAWMPGVLLVSTVPALYVILRTSRRYHAWSNAATVLRRRIQYFDLLLTDPFYAGEVRLFGLAPRFRASYRALRHQFRNERLGQLRSQLGARLFAELVALAVSGVAMAWMLYRAVNGVYSLGDLALFAQAFQRGQGLARTLLGNLGDLYSHSLYLGNLFTFLGLESRVTEVPEPITAPATLRGGIRFEDVEFRYPGSESPSLSGFNAFIPAGSIVALVGENGAGKTTALKLLARFYDPQRGRVTLDGVDIRDMSLVSLRRTITFMFQTPGAYHFSARENIAIGSLDERPDDEQLETAVWAAGADHLVRGLPAGLDTQLGRWFPSGTELSGGQWQRLALARAFVRQAPIMLLDEPTSAMDSWAEADWFRRLRGFARGRTVILVTHRLTLARPADLILVMKDGAVAESGDHDRLVAADGLYAQSWKSQVEARERLTEMSAVL